MRRLKKCNNLFWQFFRIGCATFGGGWSVVGQMQDHFVERQQIISGEDLLDIISLGRSLPGLMTGNITVLFGYFQCGILGAMACCIGMALPPFIILIAVTFCYSQIAGFPGVAAFMSGVRAAVVPIVFWAAIRLMKNAYRFKICYAVTIVVCILYLFFNIHSLWLVVFGILTGFVICRMKGKTT